MKGPHERPCPASRLWIESALLVNEASTVIFDLQCSKRMDDKKRDRCIVFGRLSDRFYTRHDGVTIQFCRDHHGMPPFRAMNRLPYRYKNISDRMCWHRVRQMH